MIRLLRILVWREMRIGRNSETHESSSLPVMFFITVAITFSFAIGADPELLQRTGPSIIWVAALLASILPIERLIRPDMQYGWFDQWAVREISEELLVVAKIIGHFLGFAPALLIAALLVGIMSGLDMAQLITTLAGLLIAMPALAAMAVMIASLTIALPAGGILGGLLMLPLALPMLIFGSGALRSGGENGLLLLSALSLLILAIAPFAAGGAIRASRQ